MSGIEGLFKKNKGKKAATVNLSSAAYQSAELNARKNDGNALTSSDTPANLVDDDEWKDSNDSKKPVVVISTANAGFSSTLEDLSSAEQSSDLIEDLPLEAKYELLKTKNMFADVISKSTEPVAEVKPQEPVAPTVTDPFASLRGNGSSAGAYSVRDSLNIVAPATKTVSLDQEFPELGVSASTATAKSQNAVSASAWKRKPEKSEKQNGPPSEDNTPGNTPESSYERVPAQASVTVYTAAVDQIPLAGIEPTTSASLDVSGSLELKKKSKKKGVFMDVDIDSISLE